MPHTNQLRRIFRENALTIVLFSFFFIFLVGESVAGWMAENNELRDQGRPPIAWLSYVLSAGFLEASAENWESEYLEMAAFIFLTSIFIQKGSPESRGVDDREPQDRTGKPTRPGAPWPVRCGGWVLKIYENSLTIALMILFMTSFLLHAGGGARKFSEEQLLHGQPPVSMVEFLKHSEFWFQSLQNWQSEFLGIGSMVLLSIYLRQKGSPESKAVDAPHLANE